MLVFSPNWFPIFICFVKAGHRTQVFLSCPQTHTHFSLRIYRQLESGRRLGKQNLLWLQRSVSNTLQQPCLGEQRIHTGYSHTWEQTECSMDSRRGGENYYTSCLFSSDTFLALAHVIRSRGGTVTQQLLYIPPVPRAGVSFVCAQAPVISHSYSPSHSN